MSIFGPEDDFQKPERQHAGDLDMHEHKIINLKNQSE